MTTPQSAPPPYPTLAFSWTQGDPNSPPPWIDVKLPNGLLVRYYRR